MKYEFTGLTKVVLGVLLKQIVRKADKLIGGWIESEKNLDQAGNAWVSGNAWVYGDARVSGNAWVSGNACVSGNAWVSGNACVSGNARVYGDARVSGNARVLSNKDIVVVIMQPYSVTITPQNIVIGCQMRSRFNKQWKKTDKDSTPALIAQYSPLLKLLKKQVPRRKK